MHKITYVSEAAYMHQVELNEHQEEKGAYYPEGLRQAVPHVMIAQVHVGIYYFHLKPNEKFTLN